MVNKILSNNVVRLNYSLFQLVATSISYKRCIGLMTAANEIEKVLRNTTRSFMVRDIPERTVEGRYLCLKCTKQ